MRTLLLLMLVVAGLGSMAPVAAAKELARQDFSEPKELAHGGLLGAVPGVTTFPEKDGRVPALTRFRATAPHGAAVAIPAGAGVRWMVAVPAAAEVKGVPADGWYGVVSVDVLGLADGERGTLHLEARTGSRVLGKAHARIERMATRTATTEEAAVPIRRLWIRIPPARHAALVGKSIEITVRSERASAVIDEWRLDTYHRAPTRSLLGKANGKNGPDLLASGALGFHALSEHLAPAFSLLGVRKGGPADKAGLRADDLVVAVAGVPLRRSSIAAGTAWFEHSHEATLGRAIQARLEAGDKQLALTVLRDKGPKELTIRLPFQVAPAGTFPREDDWARGLRHDLIRWTASKQKENGFWPGNEAVNSCLAGLALLGTRDKQHAPAIRKLAKALLKKYPRARDVGGFSFWGIAFQGMFLCEYHLASGDKTALAWIKEAIDWLPSTTHPSKWGMPAFGHSPKGLPYDNKALMAPCAHLLVFEALATRCGVESKVWDHIKPYVLHSWSDPATKDGHGGMGYNGSYKDKNEFWSRTGLVALALHLRGHHEEMQQALTNFMVQRHQWMLNSHAYGEPGGALGLIALSTVDPKGFAKVMPQWRWRFLNAYEPGYGLRYSTAHMGAPYMGEDEIMNPAYGALLSLLDGGLVITGGEPTRWLR
jgi:hypothetical protein